MVRVLCQNAPLLPTDYTAALRHSQTNHQTAIGDPSLRCVYWIRGRGPFRARPVCESHAAHRLDARFWQRALLPRSRARARARVPLPLLFPSGCVQRRPRAPACIPRTCWGTWLTFVVLCSVQTPGENASTGFVCLVLGIIFSAIPCGARWIPLSQTESLKCQPPWGSVCPLACARTLLETHLHACARRMKYLHACACRMKLMWLGVVMVCRRRHWLFHLRRHESAQAAAHGRDGDQRWQRGAHKHGHDHANGAAWGALQFTADTTHRPSASATHP